METSERIRWRTLLVWIALVTGPPFVASTSLVLWDLPAVATTGICPGAPPDVSPYPCSPLEYLVRMTVGPWAAMGHAALWTAWLGMVAVGVAGIRLGRRLRTGGRRPPIGGARDGPRF